VAMPICCLKRAYCCSVKSSCCPDATAVSETDGVRVVVADSARSTCCLKRAYCCSINGPCCHNAVLPGPAA
jgi:hypothetical protein